MTVHDYEDEECPKCSEVAAWTSAPPMEPGLYHYSFVFMGKRHYHAASVWDSGDGNMVYSMTGEPTEITKDQIAPGIEWWPIPIPEPPSQITPPISDKGDPAQ